MTVAHVYYLYSLSFHFLPRFPLFLDSIILKKKMYIFFTARGTKTLQDFIESLPHKCFE